MFNVKIKKHIHSTFSAYSTGDVFVEKNLKLPFAPYPGLRVTDGFEDDLYFKEVYYDIKTGIFNCYEDADEELYDLAKRSGSFLSYKNPERLEAIVKEYTEMGWKKSKSH